MWHRLLLKKKKKFHIVHWLHKRSLQVSVKGTGFISPCGRFSPLMTGLPRVPLAPRYRPIPPPSEWINTVVGLIPHIPDHIPASHKPTAPCSVNLQSLHTQTWFSRSCSPVQPSIEGSWKVGMRRERFCTQFIPVGESDPNHKEEMLAPTFLIMGATIKLKLLEEMVLYSSLLD